MRTSFFSVLCMLGCLFYSYNSHSQVVINEYSASNVSSFVDNYDEYPDWIELYNTGNTAVQLGGYYLSDDPNEPNKWQFPVGMSIQAHGFLRVWASGRDEYVGGVAHTSFKFTQTKAEPETVVLANPAAAIIDQQILSITQVGHSNGRTTDGNASWSVFAAPTPGGTNNNATPYQRYAARPAVNNQGGFYSGQVTVIPANNEPNSKLRYTLDGSEPVETSPVAPSSINIPQTKIIKLRAFSNDASILPSLIEYNTYLINENTTLPVMSLAANNLTTLLNGNSSVYPVGSMEYFNRAKVRTTTSYGEFDKHGQDSWVHDQRSLDIRSRDDFGYNNALYEQFFKSSERTEFQRLIIRACGDDNYPGIDSSAHIRDDFVESLSQTSGQKLDCRKSERCLLFANGQYWGVYSIREKVDDADYCEYYYGQDRYHLQFIMLWGNIWAEYGGQEALNDYQDFYNFVMSNDMSDPDNYATVCNQYDVTSLADYMIINSFVVCSDWLNWNVGWWRGLDSAGMHKKWAYILWDEDATFGHYINYTYIPAQSPYVSPCFHEDLNNPFSDPGGHVGVLVKLRENPEFDQYYINRYVDLLNTTFKPSFCVPYLDSMANIIEPEMPRHFTRWGGNMTKWQQNVQKIKDFITTRYSVIYEGLSSCYSLTGPYNVTLNVEPAGAGNIRINSIVPDHYPWTGKYFGNIDLKLYAIPSNPDYKFDHWEVQNSSFTPSDTATMIRMQITQADQVKAVFVPKQMNDSLVINEINYNSSPSFDPGDWIELYNPQPYEVNAAGWVFKDEDNGHAFSIPQGTSIPAYGYLVLAIDTNMFKSKFPEVTNFVGPVGFGLSGGGELLRLYNPDDLLVDTVNYDDVAPWPTEPDGNGPTLELINPGLDNALAPSWKASCAPHGTPGQMNCVSVGLPKLDPIEHAICKLVPNPFNNQALFSIKTKTALVNGKLNVYDFMGRLVQTYQLNSDQSVVIDKASLPAGFYNYRYEANSGKVQAHGSLIISN